MKDLFKVLPAFAPDYSGVCSIFYEMEGICVTHDGGGCIGHTLQVDETRWSMQKRAVFTSNLREIETATGDDERIIGKLMYAVKALDGKFLVLAGTPIPMMTGFDYKAIARIVEKRAGVPCIGLETSGYKFYDEGQSMAYMELLHKFKDSETEKKNEVNVLGATQLDMWDKNSVRELRMILQEAGINSAAFWGAGATVEDIACSTKAKLNIVVSNSGLEAAVYLEETANIPYIVGFPVGNKEKERYIKKVRNAMKGTGTVTDDIENTANQTAYHKVLIIGEYIHSECIRRCLESEYGIEDIQVASYFRMPERYIRECDIKLEEEADLTACVLRGNYDLIIGDIMFRKLLPKYEHTYLENPHMGVSGIIYLARAYNYVGEKGSLSFNHYLNCEQLCKNKKI